MLLLLCLLHADARIDTSSSFGPDAATCSPKLKGAVATFENVFVYAMIAKTNLAMKAISPATVKGFKAFATQVTSPRKPAAQVSVASLDKKIEAVQDVFAGAFDKIHKGLKRDFEKKMLDVKGVLVDKLDKLVNVCGITYVMHGDVTVTQTDSSSKKDKTYKGTMEIPLVWDDAISQLPAFVMSALPYKSIVGDGLNAVGEATGGTGRQGQDGLEGTVTSILPAIRDVLDLASMCVGPLADSVPEIIPGSIKLLLQEYSY
jgi:hypothetical protein